MDFISLILLGAIIYCINYIRCLLKSENKPSQTNINFKSDYYQNSSPKNYFIPLDSNEKINSQFSIIKNTEFYNKKINPGTQINKYGYLCFKNSNIPVHRYIMQKHLGRKLSPLEVVHHKDGNKLNNNIWNLKLFPNQAEHTRYHWNLLRKYGSWYGKKSSYIAY